MESARANEPEAGIRLAGLDIGPGWGPWLGRAVRFHPLDGARG
ncbi:hypothetical protein WME90_42015 [Sorangium sp. So ce375]